MRRIPAIPSRSVPAGALLLMSALLTGCSFDPPRFGQEQVVVPNPSVAFRGDDGRLLLGFYVEREDRALSGWHWLTAEPALAAEAMSPLAEGRDIGGWYEASFYYWADQASLEPALLEPGLPDDTPPGGHGELTELGLVMDDAYQHCRLTEPGASDRPRTPLLTFVPASQVEQSEEDAQTMARARRVRDVVMLPVDLAAAPIRYLALQRAFRNLDF